MQDEHFGIAIVEMMSAGLVTIAHASGGPLHDIIGRHEDQIGFLANSTQEFSQFIIKAMTKFDTQEISDLRGSARIHVNDNFTIMSFDSKFAKMVSKVL